MNEDIMYISENKAERIIETRDPLGKFICLDCQTWVAIDNQTGDAWTEQFKSMLEAENWLNTR